MISFTIVWHTMQIKNQPVMLYRNPVRCIQCRRNAYMQDYIYASSTWHVMSSVWMQYKHYMHSSVVELTFGIFSFLPIGH